MQENELKQLDALLSELIIEVARHGLPKSHIHNINDLRHKTLTAVNKARSKAWKQSAPSSLSQQQSA